MMAPVIDKPVIRAIERLLIWLEEWTGKDASFYLAVLSFCWVAVTTMYAMIIKNGVDRWVWIGLIALLVFAVVLDFIPKKKAEIARACRSQMPVKANPFYYGYGSIIRPFEYVIIVGQSVDGLSQGYSLDDILSIGMAVSAVTFWLVVAADTYPSTGGKKLKQKLTEISAGGAKLAKLRF